MTELKDGGTRKTYGTGAQKEDDSKTEGKGAYHLLPPHPIRKVAEIYRKGAMKYSARNWEKGIPLSRFLDSAKRHLDQFAEGWEDEDHLHQAIWNLFGISHTMEQIRRGNLPLSLQDLPSYPIPDIPFRKPGPGLELDDGDKGKQEATKDEKQTSASTPVETHYLFCRDCVHFWIHLEPGNHPTWYTCSQGPVATAQDRTYMRPYQLACEYFREKKEFDAKEEE